MSKAKHSRWWWRNWGDAASADRRRRVDPTEHAGARWCVTSFVWLSYAHVKIELKLDPFRRVKTMRSET